MDDKRCLEISRSQFTPSLLRSLLGNDILMVRISNFLDEEHCYAATEAVKKHGIDFYAHAYPRIGKIGITQNEHKTSAYAQEEYFRKAPAAKQELKQIMQACDEDLLAVVMQCINSIWPEGVSIAHESLTKEYFAGVIRVITQVLPHFDWAPNDAQGWSIANITSQLSWNLFLQIGNEGGVTRVYDHLWTPKDNTFCYPNSYNYDAAVIAGDSWVEVSPKRGDFIIFNSRNFHEVIITTDNIDRITLSSFIGLEEGTHKLVFWS